MFIIIIIIKYNKKIVKFYARMGSDESRGREKNGNEKRLAAATLLRSRRHQEKSLTI